MADAEQAEIAERSPNITQFIYGILSVATVVAAEGTRLETYDDLVWASVVTMALVWLAHAYADHLGRRLKRANRWTLREFLLCLENEATILAGALLPVAVLGASWAASARVETGVTASLWTAGAELVLFELVASLRRRLSGRDTVVETAIGASLGLGILAVHLLLH